MYAYGHNVHTITGLGVAILQAQPNMPLLGTTWVVSKPATDIVQSA
jgi:metal-dependent amidase/aminoacylase/carboxypeptidase family protein